METEGADIVDIPDEPDEADGEDYEEAKDLTPDVSAGDAVPDDGPPEDDPDTPTEED